MASTEALPFDHLTEEDIAGCMALSAEAGWNQTADDWALFMRYGTVFGLRGAQAGPVATGAVLAYSDTFAWISMVLVTASRRRARIGTRILQACCAELARRSLIAVLDATPAGERVYHPLGFEPMFELSRWQGHATGARAARRDAFTGVRPMRANDLAAVAALDTAAFGARRTFLLESLYGRSPRLAFMTEQADGFVLARPGRIATQIGPIVAADEDAATALLCAALDSVSGPVFFDLCDRWRRLINCVEQRNFTVQRPFLRMALRRSAPFGEVARTFVVAGPEFG
jgi:GNAT superfamily N-acetyltransferase